MNHTLTIVVPVYNEERHIKACLDAIAKQTKMPDEVIVVDNNCTDRTIEIASKYPFVKIVKEPLQGRVAARTRGIDSATSEVVGRIDADSVIAPDWCEQVVSSFSADSELSGLTGLGQSSPLPFIRHPKIKLWSRMYFWFVRASFKSEAMWGANMAIKREAWDAVKAELSPDDDIVHEDQDMSLCMAAKGLKIAKNDKMLITIDGQTYRFLPKFWRYIHMQRSTLALHKKKRTFKSPQFKKLKIHEYIGGFLAGVLIAPFAFVIFVLLMYPIDLLAIRIFGAGEWLGNSSN